METEQKKSIRERIYDIIEPKSGANKYANIYDIIMVVVILISFVPLLFKADLLYLDLIDFGCAIVFSIDYLLRWGTADLKLGGKGIRSFIRYPFTAIAIMDFLSILPGLFQFNPAFKIFRLVRLLRTLQLLRLIRLFHYSRNIELMGRVFQKQKQALILVFILAIGYIIVSAMVLFNVEPDIFGNFFDALYWATISLTTVGYGDIYAVSDIGRFVTMISAFVGIAVVALPAGIITAGYVNEINRGYQNDAEGRKNGFSVIDLIDRGDESIETSEDDINDVTRQTDDPSEKQS